MYVKVNFKKSAFLIILYIILIGSTGCSTFKKIPPQESLPQNPNFPTNEFGETYGSALGVSPYEKEPDLIGAVGIDGTIGYIRLTELNGEEPKTPEEALAQQAKENGREINLYKSDGKTIIGKFVIGK
jgi:hypothetical protein